MNAVLRSGNRDALCSVDTNPNMPMEMDTSRRQRTAAKRLAADLRAYRMGRHVSLSTVREKTKISRGILEEFESSGLADNPLFNRVYLRSLVTSYARCVGLDESRALASLDAALEGVYEGGLQGAPDDKPGESMDLNGQSDEDNSGVGESHDMSIELDSEPARSTLASMADFLGRHGESSDPGDERRHTEISTAVTGFKEPEEQRGLIVQPGRVRAIVFGFVVVVITVSAVVIALRLSSSSAQTGAAELAAVEATRNDVAIETVDQDPPPEQPIEPKTTETIPIPARTIAIGDTIAVTLIAAGGPLDPIRVRLDRDLRRPYWIDERDSLTFQMTQRIVVQDLLGRLQIEVEGVPYPFRAAGDSAEVFLTRETVRSFVESLGSR